MNKNAIVTICEGGFFEKIGKLTFPFIEKYAKKVNAEIINLSYNFYSDYYFISPHWKKFCLYNLFNKYDRILYLDIDILIKENCPNLFDIIPKDSIGIFNEGCFVDRQSSLHEAVINYQEDLKWNRTYYNTGVMVLSRIHKQLFKMPEVQHIMGMFEQSYLNLRIINDNYKVFPLDYKFNRMWIMDKLIGEHRLNSNIIHYAGANKDKIIDIISDDISNINNDYSKKNIYIIVGGGLGDQIEAEPVVRYIRNNVYPNDNIFVKSNWTRIFKHLDVKIIDKWESEDPYFKMETMPVVDSLIWNVIPHTLCHSVDFSSMATIHKIIPDHNKQIKYDIEKDDFENLSKIINLNLLENMILVNPGRGWPSKTFPSEWWKKLIWLLSKDNQVGIIGKHVSDDQGYIDIDLSFGENNIFDFRDLLSLEETFVLISLCKILISNDSAPIHMAGAFDNWIVLIPTCKHPDNVLPYRNGNKYYKSLAIYNKLTVDRFDNSPTQLYKQTIDEVIGDINDYLPIPEFVFHEINKVILEREDNNG